MFNIEQNQVGKKGMKRYSKEELSHMTTYQLREICISEKIINGILANFDRDEYIYIRSYGLEGKKVTF